MTWPAARCLAVNPATGETCALHHGHAGPHEVASPGWASPPAPPGPPPPPTVAPAAPAPTAQAAEAVIVRVYQGHNLKDATKAYERDARDLARQGFVPIGQSWSPEKHGFTDARIGPFRPKGTLSVTYRGAAVAPPVSPAPRELPPGTLW